MQFHLQKSIANNKKDILIGNCHVSCKTHVKRQRLQNQSDEFEAGGPVFD